MRRLALLLRRSRLAAGLVLVFVLGTLLVEAATLPHVHTGGAPGFYNHDHDLTLMARLSGEVPLPAALPSLAAFVCLAVAVVAADPAPKSAPRVGGESRAPPLA